MSSHRSSSHNKVKLSKCYSSEVPGQISEYFFFRAGQPQQHEDEEEEDFQDGTVDSGLSSDGTGEGFTPPPLIRRNMAATIRKGELDDSQSDVSADSLAPNEELTTVPHQPSSSNKEKSSKKKLPSNLLKEIRQKAGDNKEETSMADQLGKAMEQIKLRNLSNSSKSSATRVKVNIIPTNKCPASLNFDLHRFHLRENVVSLPDMSSANELQTPEDLSFVGLKDIMSVEKSATIRSHKSGTVRGVRNRVRAGITTYLQGKTFKSYAEREHGKVVVYTTSMGVVRQTYQRCLQVQRILGTLLISYEERDVSMNRQVQQELKDRMNCSRIVVPQVFVEGQFLGDADMIEKLNESGDLRQILRRYKRIGPETICDACGGFRYLPCSICSGSKKSIHRNHFTAEFVALKCITCNEAGLVRCSLCCSNPSD